MMKTKKTHTQKNELNVLLFLKVPKQLGYMNSDYRTTNNMTPMEKTLKNPHLLVDQAGSKIVDLVRYMTSTSSKKADR